MQQHQRCRRRYRRRLRFPYAKITLFLVLIFSFDIQERIEKYRQYFRRDYDFCPSCFQHQVKTCSKFFDTVTDDTSSFTLHKFIDLFSINTKRATSILRFKPGKKKKNTATKIFGKHLPNAKLNTRTWRKNIPQLKKAFINTKRVDGFQYCPLKNVSIFVDYLERKTHHKKLSIWLHLMLNIEPILFPLLESLRFPVPNNLAACGFSLYQDYAGETLLHYYDAPYGTKLRIARQLIDAAIRFSFGFDEYRIYVTDMSPDNIVYNEKTDRLSFIDLDTVLIVRSPCQATCATTQAADKHIHIECDDCFAWSQALVCDAELSDMNIFSACQLLREDLNRRKWMGLLHPLPENILYAYPHFWLLLDECVSCEGDKCVNRFAMAYELLQLFDEILSKFYK